MEDVRPLRLRVLRRARSHLEKIEEFIGRDRPQAARKVGARLRDSFDFLCEFPGVGHNGREPGTREWPVPGLPYVIVFRAKRDTLQIIGVFHGARQYRD